MSLARAEKKNILLILTGSIAVYKACDLISKIVQNDAFDIDVVLSKSAQKFIGASLIEGLIGKKAHADMWESGAAMEHIRLARWANLIVAYPATANFINKMASGFADSLETNLFLANDFSVTEWWIAPAMNSFMLAHPATQRSLQTLRAWGVRIMETDEGRLACGETGCGRLLEPADMLSKIENYFLGLESFKRLNAEVVITSGGTVEPIDSVRVITNRSTGTTGSVLAERIAAKGIPVVYFYGENAKRPRTDRLIKEIPFGSAKNLKDVLFAELARLKKSKKEVVLVHAAAVADYSPAEGKGEGKLKSDSEFLNIRLKINPKIVGAIKEKFPSVKLIAFKLTCENSSRARQDAVAQLFARSKADAIVHNDADEWKWGEDRHRFTWQERGGKRQSPCLLEDRNQLAEKVISFIKKAKPLRAGRGA